MKPKLTTTIACAAAMLTGALWADTEKVDGYTWTYQIKNGKAEITSGIISKRAVEPAPRAAETLVIPSKLGGKPVAAIGDYAFLNCSNMSDVTIPSTVTEISISAFANCSKLRSVKLPDNLVHIYGGAFSGCSALQCVEFGKKMAYIDYKAFENCSRLVAAIFRGNAPTAVSESSFSGVSPACCVYTTKASKGWPEGTPAMWYGLEVLRADYVVTVNVKAAGAADDNAWQGTVSGGGSFAVGKKATLKATPGAGSAFGGWVDNKSGEFLSYSTSYSYTVTGAETDFRALFVSTGFDQMKFEIDQKDIVADADGTVYEVVGVTSPSEPKITFKNLPAGVKFNAAKRVLEGTATKPGIYEVKISATNKSDKNGYASTFLFTVPNLVDPEIKIADHYGEPDNGLIPGAYIIYTIDGAAGCKVTGLPPGLKWTDKAITDKTYGAIPAHSVYGAVTKAYPTAWTAYFTKTVGKVKHTATATFYVDSFRLLNVSADGFGQVKGGGGYPAFAMASLGAKADPGYVFSGWYELDGANQELLSRSAAYKYEVGLSLESTVYGKFITVEEDAKNVSATIITPDLGYALTTDYTYNIKIPCGVLVMWSLKVDALSETKVRFARLPTGLKFTDKEVYDKTIGETIPANTIYGYPTKPQAIPYPVRLTVVTAGKTTKEYNINVDVKERDSWATGTFSGGSSGGQASITIADAGKISGKWIDLGGSTFTLSAGGFSEYDEDAKKYTFSLAVKGSDVPIPARLTQSGVIEFLNGSKADLYPQIAWKTDDPWKTIGPKLAKSAGLTFTEKYGDDQYVFTLKFAADGSVKATCAYTGADGVKASASGSSLFTPTNYPYPDDGPFDGLIHLCLPRKGKFPGWAKRLSVTWTGTGFVFTGS